MMLSNCPSDAGDAKQCVHFVLVGYATQRLDHNEDCVSSHIWLLRRFVTIRGTTLINVYYIVSLYQFDWKEYLATRVKTLFHK